ncbi:hypothetical protein [Streptomyces sp. NBC_00207]|uniref:hypothetical protein n=1 Tax=Streptomyces sp. NBC_00207 TaxID=2903635 RepID=UPI0032475D8D
MEPEEILALYQWREGACFRHPALGTTQTTHLGTLHPRAGDEADIRGCRACVLDLEAERMRAAMRAGLRYEPGHLGS